LEERVLAEQVVTYECDGTIALIGLNRTAKRNALNHALETQLREAALRAHDEAKVGVIYSHGKDFCAGLDLVEAATWIDNPEDRARRRRRRFERAFDDIARGPIPFVAAVSGACVGGGLELAISCHVRVADVTTFFGLPEGQRGIFVGAGGSVRISRALGVERMTDLMLTGRVLTAEEGERYNLVQYLVAKGEALERAKSLAARIGENAPLSNWAIVNCLPRIPDMSYDDGLFVERLVTGAVSSPESAERLKAFAEKRAKRLAEPGTSGDGRSAIREK
jgi:enoyl-CoA hydratase/carnithine racemase